MIALLALLQAEPQAENIRKHATYLASDELEGRLAGRPGCDKACEYIAKHFAGASFQEFSPDKDKKIKTRNVIVFRKGTDDKLRGEAVVLGAHYDHLGAADQPFERGRIGGTGGDTIWNGADDNASGSSALLEIARCLGPTKRSVVFVWFSAEEWGLKGSRYFVEHPPDARPVAMINLDMLGRNSDKPCMVSGTGTCAAWEPLLDSRDANLTFTRAVTSGSDHVSFAEKKIPAVHFFTGFHSDYHRITDHADRLDCARIAVLARAALRLAAALADRAEAPAWTDPPPE